MTSFYVYEWAKALAMSGLAAGVWSLTAAVIVGLFTKEPVEIEVSTTKKGK